MGERRVAIEREEQGHPSGGVRVEGRWKCPEEMGEGPGRHQAHGVHQSSVRLHPPSVLHLLWDVVLESLGSRGTSVISWSSPPATLHLLQDLGDTSWSHQACGGHQSPAPHRTIHVASPLGPGSRIVEPPCSWGVNNYQLVFPPAVLPL